MTENEALKKHKEDCKRCRDKACKHNHQCLQKKDIDVYERLMAFEAIGTIEEFKALKEKEKSLSREIRHGDYFCPKCGSLVEYQGYCHACGQKVH